MYVPTAETGPVRRVWVRDLDAWPTTTQIYTDEAEFGDRTLIEIARGCGRGCRFCMAGFTYRPMREVSLETILAAARHGLKYRDRVGLVSAAVSDHTQIDQIAVELRALGARIAIASLRVDPISEPLIRALAESNTQTLTIAPEAGSTRLRRVINKPQSDEQLLYAVDLAARYNFPQLKLYFMIGMPTETEDDVEEIIELAFEIKELTKRRRSGCHLILTIEPFVPKAGTPFQWLPMASQKILRQRLSYLKRRLEKRGIEVRSESISWAAVQGVLSRGDSRLAPVLTKVAEDRTLSTWRQALTECALDADYYTGREIPLNERLPWNYIDSGVKNDYLETELARAGCDKVTPPCPIATECHRCGVC
jgi:radical SAM superfamily enzyme YgiQ (UPF0313 family)